MLYDLPTVKNNLNIDVMTAYESGVTSIFKLIAIAAAPVTRCEHIPTDTTGLFHYVRYLCMFHRELKTMPYEDLLVYFEDWARSCPRKKRKAIVRDIAIIDKVMLSGIVFNEKLYRAYKSIRDSGRYTKMDYSDAKPIKSHTRPTKLANTQQSHYWVMVCTSHTISDILDEGYIPEIDLTSLLDEKGNRTSVQVQNYDCLILQDEETEELWGMGVMILDEGNRIIQIDWRNDEKLPLVIPLIGDKEMEPYLIINSGRKAALNNMLNHIWDNNE